MWTSYGTDYWFREPPHAAAVAFRVPGEGAGGQAIPVDRPVNPIVFPSPRPKRTSATEHIILRT